MTDAAPFSRFASPTNRERPPLRHSKSTDALHANESRASSAAVAAPETNLRPRSSSVVASPPNDSRAPPVRSATVDLPALVATKDAPLQQHHHPSLSSSSSPFWRLLPFLTRDPNPPGAPRDVSPGATEVKHRPGDVVCLSYATLDDRGMRRLEGRSDHRPVVGSYAVYV
jgi:hypothetical protein